jgi:hypothetical protein
VSRPRPSSLSKESLANLLHDQTTRIGRTLVLLEDHGSEVRRLERGTYSVPSGNGTHSYTVHYGGDIEDCSCPDFLYRGAETRDACKPLLALRVLMAKGRRRKPIPSSICSNPYPRRSLLEVGEDRVDGMMVGPEDLLWSYCAKSVGVL